jgi:hypothetical protein
MPIKEAVALNQQHHDISSEIVAQHHGRTRTQGETQTLTLRMLRGIPADLLAVAHLRLDLDTAAGAASSVLKRVTH